MLTVGEIARRTGLTVRPPIRPSTHPATHPSGDPATQRFVAVHPNRPSCCVTRVPKGDPCLRSRRLEP